MKSTVKWSSKDGGYATSLTYVEKLCSIIEKWNRTQYDVKDSGGEVIRWYRVCKSWADSKTQKGALRFWIMRRSVLIRIWDIRCSTLTARFSGLALQRLSDIVCFENGYSIIEKKPYAEREKRTVYPKRHTIRDELRSVLDDLIQNKPKDWEDYLRLLREEGYEIKHGKHLALKGRAQKKFIRLDSLGEGYSEEALRQKIYFANVREVKQEAPSYEVDLLIDIQNRALGKGAGYTTWAKKYNLKQTGKTLLFLQEHNIHSYDDLEKAVQTTTEGADYLLAAIREKDTRIKEIDALKQHIFNYSKTHQIYLEYKRMPKGKKDAFYEAHRAELELHEAAKNVFDALPKKTKLPTIKALNLERKTLIEERKKEYEQYRTLRDQKKEFQKAKQNTDMILGKTQEERDERPREK